MTRWFLTCSMLFMVSMNTQAITSLVRTLPNDAQTTVTVSNDDINRLFVTDDRITQIHAPQARLKAEHDAHGSLYVTVLGDKPFTAFILTESGRHFGLLMNPKHMPGSSIRINPTTPRQTIEPPIERVIIYPSQGYTHQIVGILQALLHQQVPNGFSVLPKMTWRKPLASKQTPRHTQSISSQQQAMFVGREFDARVMILRNISHHAVMLSVRSFQQATTVALAFTKRQLAPGQTATLYEIRHHA